MKIKKIFFHIIFITCPVLHNAFSLFILFNQFNLYLYFYYVINHVQESFQNDG
jgi:hypothetical protein